MDQLWFNQNYKIDSNLHECVHQRSCKIESSLSGNRLDWLFTNCLVRLLLMDGRNKSQWLAAYYGHDTLSSGVYRLSPGGLQSDLIT